MAVLHAMSVYKKRSKILTSIVSYFLLNFDYSSFLIFRNFHSHSFLNVREKNHGRFLIFPFQVPTLMGKKNLMTYRATADNIQHQGSFTFYVDRNSRFFHPYLPPCRQA